LTRSLLLQIPGPAALRTSQPQERVTNSCRLISTGCSDTQLTWCCRSFLSTNSHPAFCLLCGSYSPACRVLATTSPMETAVGLLGFSSWLQRTRFAWRKRKKKKAIFDYKIYLCITWPYDASAVIPSSCERQEAGDQPRQHVLEIARCGGRGGDTAALPFSPQTAECGPLPTASRANLASDERGSHGGDPGVPTGMHLCQRCAPWAIPPCLRGAVGGCSHPTRSSFPLSARFCHQVSCSPRSLGTPLPSLGSSGDVSCFLLLPQKVSFVMLCPVQAC